LRVNVDSDTWVNASSGAPERQFGLQALHYADGATRLSMRIGDWTRGPDGKPSGAAIGVLVDDMLGFSSVPARPARTWPVSTEISIDFVNDPPTGDGLVWAQGRLVAVRGMTALMSGTVSDEAGNLLAVASMRNRFIPSEPDLAAYGDGAGQPAAPDHDSLFDLLDAAPSTGGDGTATLTVPPNPEFGNPLGVLHGGVALCASHLVGGLALAPEGQLCVASIRIAYLRPISVSALMEFVATAVHRGSRFGVAEVVIHDMAGKPCVVATVAGNRID
jgi:uncharacterized protein (TIGR00369 family)